MFCVTYLGVDLVEVGPSSQALDRLLQRLQGRRPVLLLVPQTRLGTRGCVWCVVWG